MPILLLSSLSLSDHFQHTCYAFHYQIFLRTFFCITLHCIISTSNTCNLNSISPWKKRGVTTLLIHESHVYKSSISEANGRVRGVIFFMQHTPIWGIKIDYQANWRIIFVSLFLLFLRVNYTLQATKEIS